MKIYIFKHMLLAISFFLLLLLSHSTFSWNTICMDYFFHEVFSFFFLSVFSAWNFRTIFLLTFSYIIKITFVIRCLWLWWIYQKSVIISAMSLKIFVLLRLLLNFLSYWALYCADDGNAYVAISVDFTFSSVRQAQHLSKASTFDKHIHIHTPNLRIHHISV